MGQFILISVLSVTSSFAFAHGDMQTGRAGRTAHLNLLLGEGNSSCAELQTKVQNAFETGAVAVEVKSWLPPQRSANVVEFHIQHVRVSAPGTQEVWGLNCGTGQPRVGVLVKNEFNNLEFCALGCKL